jgi:hypothetical protein
MGKIKNTALFFTLGLLPPAGITPVIAAGLQNIISDACRRHRIPYPTWL